MHLLLARSARCVLLVVLVWVFWAAQQQCIGLHTPCSCCKGGSKLRAGGSGTQLGGVSSLQGRWPHPWAVWLCGASSVAAGEEGPSSVGQCVGWLAAHGSPEIWPTAMYNT